MKEEIKHSLRESIKREKLFSKSLTDKSLKYFLLEQIGILDAIEQSNFDPIIKSAKQYIKDVKAAAKILDRAVKQIEATDLADIERNGEEFGKRVQQIANGIEDDVKNANPDVPETLDFSQMFSYLVAEKGKMDGMVLTFAAALRAAAEFLGDYNLPISDIPEDLKVSDLYDNAGAFTSLPMSEEEIEKLQADEEALNKKEEELRKFPDEYELDQAIRDAAKEVDLSDLEDNLKPAWEELSKTNNEYVDEIQQALEKIKVSASLADFDGLIKSSSVVKVLGGDSIANSLESAIGKLQAAPLLDPEKLAAQGTEETMEQSGIGVSEQEMVDFIEKYLVKKLGIGGSADNSVALFLKLADSNAGLLDDSDIRRLANA